MTTPLRSPQPLSRGDQIKNLIRRRYTRVAAGSGFAVSGRVRAREAGYPERWLVRFPPQSWEAYCGCGCLPQEIDLTGVKRVLDLGCGAGMDACLLGEIAGPGVTVFALDLTLSMARRAGENARTLGLENVRPLAGDMERLPLQSGTADLVVANASFNLAVDPRAAYSEVARVLRPGGRLVCLELVRDGPLPPDLAEDPMGWNASLGGVVEEAALRETVQSGGLEGVRISGHRTFPPVMAVRLEASKP